MWIDIRIGKAYALSNFWYKDTLYTWEDLTIATEPSFCIQEFSKKLMSEGFFWVDERIMEMIIYLNLSGYRTVASCSGHPWNYPSDCYVLFEEGVEFNEFPIPIPNPIWMSVKESKFHIEGKLRWGINSTKYSDLEDTVQQINSMSRRLVRDKIDYRCYPITEVSPETLRCKSFKFYTPNETAPRRRLTPCSCKGNI